MACAAAATTFLRSDAHKIGARTAAMREPCRLGRSTQLAFVKALGQLKKILLLHTHILVRQRTRTVSWYKTEKSSAQRLIRAAAPRAAHEDNIMRR